MGDVIHVDEPSRRRSVMFSDSESVNADEEVERPYTAPILADDEVAKDPSPHVNHPAVELPLEVEEAVSRPTSRPTSLYKETSFELRPTPLEDVDEYEPLFNDDEKQEAKRLAEEEKLKNNHKQRFPSADIWEDAPSSAYHTAEVSTPELFDDLEKPSPTAVPPPREGETPAQAFARHQEELAEKEAREHGPDGVIPARSMPKPLWAQHQQHLAAETVKARPQPHQRFPSRDVWEDTPDSLKLETTVSTPQQDEVSSPADAVSKPEIPERPQKSPAPTGTATEKPAIPERPKPRQASGDDKPVVPERPKPQIPARPAKAGPTSGGLEPAEAAAPPPRQKPAVPARPMGSKIAALQAGFMNDLNRRLQLGPQAPPSKESKAEEEQAAEEEKEKVPLSDARKGRARGPQRRAPTAATAAATAAPAATADDKPKQVVSLGFAAAVSVFEIDPDDDEGTVSLGGAKTGTGAGAREVGAEEAKEVGAEKEESAGVEERRIEVEAEADAEAPVPEKTENGDGKAEEEVEAEKDKEEAQTGDEAEPAPANEPAKEPEKEEEKEETKSLATNMAGETLIEERVKTGGNHLSVEPVKVEER